jgi:hypothetical protein
MGWNLFELLSLAFMNLQRELVLCTHDILACKRDHVARSLLVNNPFFLPEVSSESATTSLKGNTDDYKSCSDAIQRSDDITVDSTVSVKHRIKVPVSMDADQKTDDDSSTSQIFLARKLTEREQFSGKQIPHRPSVASPNLSDEGGWRSKSRKVWSIFVNHATLVTLLFLLELGLMLLLYLFTAC